MSKAFRRYSSRIQTSMGDVTKITEESVHGQRIVKVFGGQEHEKQHFADINQRNFRFNVRLVAVQAAGDNLTAYVVVLGVCGGDVPLVRGSERAGVHRLRDGDGHGAHAAQALDQRQRGRAARHRGGSGVFEILDEPSEKDTGTADLGRAHGDVEYRDVAFAYAPDKPPALRGVSLTLKAGTTVALVGQSGSGKSTIASLLPRFYEPDSGAVLLDGRDIRDYPLRDLRRQLSLVSQDVVLFDDSIAGNIAYGALERSPREAIEAAAEAAYVAEFASELPEGLETRVGERGVMLSGGQRQRIAIARALLKDAPVLILDEATSALDTESERHVQARARALMQGRTTLVIAHRLSTIEKADLIVVMREGTIVEQGTHAELVARGGYYSTLYRMQFAG